VNKTEKENARQELRNAIDTVWGFTEQIALTGHFCHSLRRELTAAQRQANLSRGGSPAPGIFEKQQLAMLEATERLRETLSDIGTYPKQSEVLKLMMALCEERREEELDPRVGHPLWNQAKDGFEIAGKIMAELDKLSRLSELTDLPRTILADAPDLVAAASTGVIPSEERISSIVATGATCVSLLKEFCNYRGIRTA
jgi:hypothetical protein